MTTTIIYDNKPSQVAAALVRGRDLWIPLESLPGTTNWELKPQGVCQGNLCIPIPAGHETDFIGDKSFNLTALARLRGQPVVHDERNNVWFFGESVRKRHDDLHSLRAPDFSLPDLDGKMHSLSDYAGRKVLLLSWASW